MPDVTIFSVIPDAQTVLTLEPEELACVLLMHLRSLPERDGHLNRDNFFNNPHAPSSPFFHYPPEIRDDVSNAFLAAWVWLQHEGLVLPRIGAGHSEWIQISRRGARMLSRADFDAYRRAKLFPRGNIHPTLVDRVGPTFIRGDYDTAVFQALKDVEVAVSCRGPLGWRFRC